MGARTILRAGAAVAAFALASVALAAAPAGGSTAGVVVRVDALYVHMVSNECVPDYPIQWCTRQYSGVGLTVDGQRQWTYRMTLVEYRTCMGAVGRWELVADDGSGDGLSGQISDGDRTVNMVVMAGTGAYAGATSDYSEQPFGPIGVPVSFPIGCNGSNDIGGDWAGSLEFHLF